MRALRHIMTAGAILLAFLVLPALVSVDTAALRRAAGYDAVSAATQIITDKPSGGYVIIINDSLKYYDTWQEFFSDKDVPVIMEDISCLVINGDENGLEAARMYQSRLPENQMKIKQAEGLFVMSKAEAGLFDVVIASKEFADAYRADTIKGNTD